jgi:hypothetical protein
MKTFNQYKEIKKAKRDIRNIKMTSDEKLAMHGQLMSYVDTHAPTGRVKSPYWQFFMWSSSAASEKFAYVFAVLFIVIVGAGTSLASEKALPGDILYSMKVGVTEPIRTALTVDPIEQVRWQGELVNRRLDEAEKLESKGQLDATTTEQIEKSFVKHEKSVKSLERRAEQTSRSKDVEKVRTDFEEKKQKHQIIIEVIRVKAEQKREARQLEQLEQQTKKDEQNKAKVRIERRAN